MPETVLRRGTEGPGAERMRFCAGPLSVVFEPATAFLRYVRLGDQEILRGVYAAVRDQNWGTVAPKVSNLRAEDAGDAFRLTFDVECKEREIDFFWTGEVVGTAQGTVTFSMEGVARSTFLRNRIGLCVLHPIRECKGRPCAVEHVDGSVERGTFPRLISPHQPFKEMRRISHEVAPGLCAEVRLEGDIFEMEDQRNWTDASYKTYCTPLEFPFPVEVTEGTEVVQSVSLTLNGELPESTSTEAADVAFVVGDAPPVRLPRIGLAAASHGRPLSRGELERLRALRLAHLRVDLYPTEPDCARGLERAAADAAGLGVPIEAAVFLSDAAEVELSTLAGELERIGAQVARWLIFREGGMTTPQGLVRLVRERLSRHTPDAEFGTGTDAFFAELNREPLFAGEADLVCYSATPQVHASDDASIVETLQVQAETVEGARRLTDGLPAVVTPVTLKPRFNPVATGPEPKLDPKELPPQVDSRQASLFAAAWTLGSIKYLSESAVHAATYYETTGWRGVMETESGTPLAEKFHSIPGTVFPVYHVLADVAEFTGGRVIPSRSSDPLRVDGVTLHKEGRNRTLLANLSSETQTVRLGCPDSVEHLSIKRLDASNAERAMRSPEAFRAEPGASVQESGGQLELVLSPYSLARLDWDDVAYG